MSNKILVNTPDGKQLIIELKEGGMYGEPSQILWDEKYSGPMPKDVVDSLGGWVVEDGQFKVDQIKLKAHQDNKRDAALAVVVAAKKKSDRVDALKATDIDNANIAQLRVIVKELIQHVLDL